LSFIILDLNESEERAELDPHQAIKRLQEWFPEATCLPGDQLTRSVDHAEVLFAGPPGSSMRGAERRVVESLRRKAGLYGPALAFQIPVDAARWIRGSARRVDITFNYDEPLPEALRNRIVEYLKSFGVGRIEQSSEDGTSTELIFDKGAID
jgi:hypothetical protein